MAEAHNSSESRSDTQAGQSHLPSQLSSHQQVPTVSEAHPSQNGPATSNVNNSTSEPSETPNSPQHPRSRRGSFSFLRRTKSREYSETRKESGGGPRKLSRRKKDRGVSKEEATAQLKMAPQLPSYHNLPQMNTPFVDGSAQNSSSQSPPTTTGQYPVFPNAQERPASKTGYDPNAFYRRHLGMADRTTPPTQAARNTTPTTAGSSPQATAQDPYPRTDSITNRGRYSYANQSGNGNVNSPRRVRRRKDPTPFNVLVVGSKGAGKTSFVDFLCHALAQPSRSSRVKGAVSTPKPETKKEQGSPFSSHYLESEVEGERIGVTIYDSNGLEKHLIDLQLREFSYFVESKFQETFREEQKVMRSAGVRDPHIHCVFVILDPSRLDNNISAATPQNQKNGDLINKPRVVGAFDQDIDVDLFKALDGKTTVVPVISKADTVTTAHMTYLKRVVWDSMKKLKIDPLQVLNMESDDEADETQPTSAAIEEKDEAATELKPNDRSRPAASETSVYDSASEGDSDGDDSDSTVSKGQPKSKSLHAPGTNGTTGSTLKPRYDEIKVSTMSENVDLPMLPLSIISPDMHDPTVIGRRFPWGMADPYDAEHCDFTRLLDNVFSEWREDFREAARERWYEGWRTNRLRTRGTVSSPANNIRATSGGTPGQGRAVSGASAYGGRGPETALLAPSASGGSSTSASRAVSATDIGVAVSSPGAPPTLPKSISMPLQSQSSYRGLGTY